jgi:hypothetical protein
MLNALFSFYILLKSFVYFQNAFNYQSVSYKTTEVAKKLKVLQISSQ